MLRTALHGISGVSCLPMRKQAAIKAIEKHGILLVFPVQNAADPLSLWHVAHPGKKMRWEWDESGDDGVAELWHLRTELSESRKAVYTKWFQGRATFFSLNVFRALLALSLTRGSERSLTRDAREVLTILREQSPLSTKQLKRETGLVGRALEPVYHKALKELWSRLLIVGYGEVDDGAFPSLAVGATSFLFEDLYREAEEMDAQEAIRIVTAVLRRSPKLDKFFRRSIGAL